MGSFNKKNGVSCKSLQKLFRKKAQINEERLIKLPRVKASSFGKLIQSVLQAVPMDKKRFGCLFHVHPMFKKGRKTLYPLGIAIF